MRTSWLFGGIMVFTTITLGLGVQAKAEEAGSPEKSMEQRLEELDQEIRILKRKRELEQESAESAKKTTPIVKAGSSGFSLESADGNNIIRFRGLIQVDHRLNLEGASDTRNRTDQRAGNLDANGFHDAADSWYLRRARPTIEGTLWG